MYNQLHYSESCNLKFMILGFDGRKKPHDIIHIFEHAEVFLGPCESLKGFTVTDYS